MENFISTSSDTFLFTLLLASSPQLLLCTILMVAAAVFQMGLIVSNHLIKTAGQAAKPSASHQTAMGNVLCFFYLATSSLLLGAFTMSAYGGRTPVNVSLIASIAAFLWLATYGTHFSKIAKQYKRNCYAISLIWTASCWVQTNVPSVASFCLALQGLLLMTCTLVPWTNTHGKRRALLYANLIQSCGLMLVAVTLLLPTQNLTRFLTLDLTLAALCFVGVGLMYFIYQYNANRNAARDLKVSYRVIEQMNQELEQRAHQSDEKIKVMQDQKKSIMSKISHELRNPLNGILGSLNLIHSENSAKLKDEHIANAKTAANQMLSLVDTLVDVNQLAANQLTLNPNPSDMAALVTEVFNSFKPTASEKGLDIQLELPKQQCTPVLVDQARLKYVLTELVHNAISFTPTGKVHLSLSFETKQTQATEICIKVTDTGIGIAREDQTLMLEAFEQADALFESQHQSVGLGLCVSYQLIQLMGGSLHLSSEKDTGTQVSIQVTLNHADGTNDQSGQRKPQQTTAYADSLGLDSNLPTGATAAHILIVEDNPVNQMVLQGIVKQMGITSDIRADGQAALDYIKAAKQPVDLVLMDLQMPVMNGLNTSKAIRKLGFHALPIIAVTANNSVDDMDAVFAAGMNDQISKPVQAQTLIKTIEKWLHKAANTAEKQNKKNKPN